MAKIGSLIDQKYEIITIIGQGGMSTVYLAIDRRLNKQWAIKEIKKTMNGRQNEIHIHSLLTEANLMKKWDHPTLPRIVDIIEENETIYIVMDYVEGKSLDVILKEKGKIQQEFVINWAKQLCEALHYLHTCKPAVIYRDMKPANIMVKPDGNVKLIDFGIAREYKQENSNDTLCLGTRGYAAPEQFGGKGQTDPRTDIYCLGVTLYHLLTGKDPAEPPYQIYPIRTWDDSLSSGLEKIIIKCTELNPEDRYQSCKELLFDLEHYTEMDDECLRVKKKNRIAFFSSLIACITFFLAGSVCQYIGNRNSETYYAQLIENAQKESNYEKKISMYQDAVDFLPERVEAYLGWIEATKENDGRFTVQEEKNLIAVVNQNKQSLMQVPQNYIEISYEIGRLYWFYYDYGDAQDSQFSRTKHAIPWFSEVVSINNEQQLEYEHYTIAVIYRDIGIFNRDYSSYVREAKINENSKLYWEYLLQFEKFLANHPDEDELILWEGYELIANSLDVYLGKFKSSGVEREEIEQFCCAVSEKIEKQVATDEMTVDIQKRIEWIMEKQIPEKLKLAYE